MSVRLVALLLCALACALAGPASAAFIDYLLVEANEGGSSGGHVAIRFGDRTYHFQNEDGRLHTRREPTARLLADYALAGNRGVRAVRIEVSEASWHRLRERFETRRLVEARQLALAEALTRERRLLEQLAAAGPHEPMLAVPLPGAGYLEPAPAGEASAALLALRGRIARERGPHFLAERRRALARRIDALDPAQTADPPRAPGEDELPPPFSTFADRYLALASVRTAMAWLDGGVRLRADGFGALENEALRLDARARRALERAAHGLDARLFALATADSPDSGHALLVALARRAALERSLATGRLVFLDAFPDDAERILPETGLLAPRWTTPLVADAAADLATAWERLVAAEAPGERELGALEEVANRYAEASRAARGEGALRVVRERLVPARTANVPTPRPPLAGAPLARALEQARVREAGWQSALDRLHGYDLVSHNCVSALLDTLQGGFEDPRGGSTEHLGGYVDPTAALHFWPLVSARAARDAYRAQDAWRLAPLRRARVAAMQHGRSGWRVALRESNTLTSTAYVHSPEDSFFLFFTDGPATTPVRPLLGAANLSAGLLHAAWGVVRAPLDRGRTFLAGVRGVVMSGPELGFFNIRKGSYPYVGRKHRERIEAVLAE